MGGSTSETNTQSNQTSTLQLPPWINDAAQQNYGFAQSVANRPLVQYQGQQVADIAPQSSQAWGLAATSGNAGQPQYNAAQAGYGGILAANAPQMQKQGAVANVSGTNVDPSKLGNYSDINTANLRGVSNVGIQAGVADIAAGQLSNTNLNPYMNPYTQSVINKTLPIMQQNLALSQNQQANAANSANAFGGSRQAVQQGVTQAQGAMGMGQMAAGLNQANFQQAQQGALADIGNRLAASEQNQQSGLTQRAQNINTLQGNQNAQLGMRGQDVNALSANLQADVAARGQNLSALQGNQNNALSAAQGNQQAGLTMRGQDITTAQNNLQAALQQEGLQNTAAAGMETLGNDAQRNVLQQYSMLSDAGQQEQTQAQNQINANMNQFNQAWNYPTQQLGILQSGLGMTPYGNTQTTQGQSSSQTQTSPDYAQSALGLLSIGAGMFKSDKRIKKNIKRIGTHAPSTLPTYSFNFKGDPPGTPKITGPIAQDVEKKYPAAVARGAGGIKHVIPSAVPGGGGMLSTQNVVPMKKSGGGLLASGKPVSTVLGTARQAPDGHHYVQHPHTGQFFRVKKSA